MGHPWTEINGPNCTRYGLRFNFHLCGKEQYLLCQCCQPGEEKYFKVRKTDSPDNLTNIGGDVQIIDNGKMTSDIIDVWLLYLPIYDIYVYLLVHGLLYIAICNSYIDYLPICLKKLSLLWYSIIINKLPRYLHTYLPN